MASVNKRRWTHKGVTKEAWVLRYTDNDRKRRMETFKSKKAADGRRLVIEQEVDMGVHTAKRETVTLGEAVDAWLRECDRRHKIGDGMAGYTLNNYIRQAHNNIIPEIGAIRLTNLTANRMQDFANDLSVRLKPSTVTNIAVILRSVLKFAVTRKWLRRNPLADQPLRVPSITGDQIDVPSKEELRSLLQVLARRRRFEQPRAYLHRVAMVMLALFAGLRRGEISGLLWENVDLEAGLIYVRHSYSSIDGLRAPKTKAGIRTVPMAPQVLAALRQLSSLIEGETTGYVLQTKGGNPVQPHHIGNAFWKPIMREAGLLKENGAVRYSFHSLRHAAASLWIEQGLAPLHIKKMIGHASVQMTYDVYGHLFPEDDATRKAVLGASEQFDRLGSVSPPTISHDLSLNKLANGKVSPQPLGIADKKHANGRIRHSFHATTAQQSSLTP